MELQSLLDRWGEPTLLACAGLVVGALFGFFAQRSRFCLRAAVIEFGRGRPGERLTVWLITFSVAVLAVQALQGLGWVNLGNARQLATRGSLSGALVGGLLFGVGMVLTRGCASRLLVLSAGGNLRALLSGLVFAVAAQSALGGALSPLRESISAWWTVEGGASRDLLALSGLGHTGGAWIGAIWLAAALWAAVRSGRLWAQWWGALGAGVAVALAWWLTGALAAQSFEVVPIEGITFGGPSAELLMRVLQRPSPALGFGLGLIPGVFIGALVGALVGREWRLEGFKDGYSMRRYIIGAVVMGFGAMLAGGCAVGAGLTGGSVFSVTAWLALCGMWAGGMLTDRLMDAPPAAAQVAP